jgi:thiol-disulfide isomerase/thioredoxin
MKYFLSLSILTLLLAGCSTANTTESTTLDITEQETTELQVIDESQEDSAKATSAYQEFSDEKYTALKGSQPFALFFHATWCPVCQELKKNLNADLSVIPEGATILETDFDQETALKKEFGVTQQTTFVFFDANGEVTDTVNNPTLEQITENLS